MYYITLKNNGIFKLNNGINQWNRIESQEIDSHVHIMRIVWQHRCNLPREWSGMSHPEQ